MSDHVDPVGLMAQGRDLAFAGRFDEAETVFRDCLAGVRGRGDAGESAACGNLGSLYGVEGRHFEAILLFRRGLGISHRLGDRTLQARHLANIAAMFVSLGLWDEAARALSECELVVDALESDPRRAVEDIALWPKASLAVHLGHVEEARLLFTRFVAAFTDRRDFAARVATAGLESDLLRKEGHPEKALQVLRDVVAAGDGSAGLDMLFLTALQVGALQALGRVDEACEEAEGFLAQVHAEVATHGHGELSIDLTSDVGDFLAEVPGRQADAHRAYDLAASMVLGRIADLDACAIAIPELSTLPEEDRAWVASLRGRYREKQSMLLSHVAVLLKEARGREAKFLHAGGSDTTLVRICAWCGRVGTRDGSWLPLAHYIPEDRDILVTHCICRSCQDAEVL